MRILYRMMTVIIFLFCMSLLIQASGENPDPERFRTEIDNFLQWDRKNAPPAAPVLFIGSSSIRLWPTHAYFPDLPVINRGFGGSHISDVNHFFDLLVLKYEPVLIIFYAGDNDIADGKSPTAVFTDYVRFIQMVHENLPKTEIIYLPIKPSPSRWTFWPAMHDANSQIKGFCENEPYLHYVDTATPMLGENLKPKSDLFVSDSLHLNQNGYDLWTRILAPRLKIIQAD